MLAPKVLKRSGRAAVVIGGCTCLGTVEIALGVFVSLLLILILFALLGVVMLFLGIAEATHR